MKTYKQYQFDQALLEDIILLINECGDPSTWPGMQTLGEDFSGFTDEVVAPEESRVIKNLMKSIKASGAIGGKIGAEAGTVVGQAAGATVAAVTGVTAIGIVTALSYMIKHGIHLYGKTKAKRQEIIQKLKTEIKKYDATSE